MPKHYPNHSPILTRMPIGLCTEFYATYPNLDNSWLCSDGPKEYLGIYANKIQLRLRKTHCACCVQYDYDERCYGFVRIGKSRIPRIICDELSDWLATNSRQGYKYIQVIIIEE